MIPCKLEYVSPSEKAPGFHKYTCARCGTDAHSPYGLDRQVCTCPDTVWPSAGEPGYWLVLALAAIGITQRRYVRAKKWLRLMPVCSCDERVTLLNTIGSRFANGLAALWKFITRK